MVYNPRFNKRPHRPYDPTKQVRHSHTPFSVVHFENDKEKVEYRCDKDGKVTITHTDKTSPNMEYDEVTVSASLIFAVAEMLNVTRKSRLQDKVKTNEPTTT